MLDYGIIKPLHLSFYPTHSAIPLFKLFLNSFMPQGTFPQGNCWFNAPFILTVPFAISPDMPFGSANTNKSAKSYQGIGK
jgi:hypothetical protein